MEQHKEFMRIAIKLSETNIRDNLGGPFGAVIVKEKKIIARSGNKVTLTNDPTAHAEVSAIRIACESLQSIDLSGCTIYTSCEPCSMCLSAIYLAKIDTIYFANTSMDAENIGFADKFIYDEIEKSIEERKLPANQLLRDEAQPAFKLWKQSVNKTDY